MKYVVVLDAPGAEGEGDDSIEALCSDVNDLFGFMGLDLSVRPLSEEIAC